MRAGRHGLCALAVLAFCAIPARAQVVEMHAGPFTPYVRTDGDASREGKPNIDPTPYALSYVTVLPGQNSKLADISLRPATLAYTYPAFELVFSVTSRSFLSAQDDSRHDVTRALQAVSRINAHVRVEALAADGKTVLPSAPTKPAVMTLMITPSDLSYAKDGPPSEIISGAAGAAAEFLGPIGGLIQGFTKAHRSTPGPSQVAYQSEDNEFGWTWFEAEGTTIEGMHRCAALFQVQKDAAYLRVSVDLVTDWKSFGLWTKPYSFIVAVAPPQTASKK